MSGFITRLQQLLTHYNLSPSAFADKVDIPRSRMSHVLSGRNRPSLDFVMKVIQAYPEVNLYWLLNGKGSFPSNMASQPSEAQPKSAATEGTNQNETDRSTTFGKNIKQVIIFYEDGTFTAYKPQE